MVQLRQDNALGTLWNMVGFQTKLRHGEQTRIFRTIPGLENAEFARLGGLHRNTFINSPRLLDGDLRLKSQPHLRFAGQVTGVEGYVESAAIGLLAGRFAAAEVKGHPSAPPPPTTAFGALALPHHRWRRRPDLSTHERQFRAFPDLAPGISARTGKPVEDQGQGPQAGHGRAGAGRSGCLAGTAAQRRSDVRFRRTDDTRRKNTRSRGPVPHVSPRATAAGTLWIFLSN